MIDIDVKFKLWNYTIHCDMVYHTWNGCHLFHAVR